MKLRSECFDSAQDLGHEDEQERLTRAALKETLNPFRSKGAFPSGPSERTKHTPSFTSITSEAWGQRFAVRMGLRLSRLQVWGSDVSRSGTGFRASQKEPLFMRQINIDISRAIQGVFGDVSLGQALISGVPKLAWQSQRWRPELTSWKEGKTLL